MEDFYKDEITALCTVEDDAEEGRSSQTSTPTSSLPPAMAAMGGGMLPDAALGAALGMPFQQVPNANNNLLLSYLQQNAFQQQQQQQGNPFLMSMLYQQQQMQQQQQQVRNVLCSEWKGASESIDSSTTVLRSTCMYQSDSSIISTMLHFLFVLTVFNRQHMPLLLQSSRISWLNFFSSSFRAARVSLLLRRRRSRSRSSRGGQISRHCSISTPPYNNSRLSRRLFLPCWTATITMVATITAPAIKNRRALPALYSCLLSTAN